MLEFGAHDRLHIKGPATRNDFVNDIVNDRSLDAIFATLKAFTPV